MAKDDVIWDNWYGNGVEKAERVIREDLKFFFTNETVS